jgi:hypothetical protein
VTWIHCLAALWLLIGLATWVMGVARHLPRAYRENRDRLGQWAAGVEVFITIGVSALILLLLMGPIATWIYINHKDDPYP